MLRPQLKAETQVNSTQHPFVAIADVHQLHWNMKECGVCLPCYRSGYLCAGACITHAPVGRPNCVVSLLGGVYGLILLLLTRWRCRPILNLTRVENVFGSRF